jgi:PHD/YefM family antitoxin component YafN of YafNO toxin-antitoxin module
VEARYLTDDKGKRVGVIIDIEEYERLREIEDEMEDIRRYDEAMAARERGESDAVPWEQVRDEISSDYGKHTD